jgi:hypothetical protein
MCDKYRMRVYTNVEHYKLWVQLGLTVAQKDMN